MGVYGPPTHPAALAVCVHSPWAGLHRPYSLRICRRVVPFLKGLDSCPVSCLELLRGCVSVLQEAMGCPLSSAEQVFVHLASLALNSVAAPVYWLSFVYLVEIMGAC